MADTHTLVRIWSHMPQEGGWAVDPEFNAMVDAAEELLGLAASRDVRENFGARYRKGATFYDLAHWLICELYRRNVQLVLEEED